MVYISLAKKRMEIYSEDRTVSAGGQKHELCVSAYGGLVVLCVLAGPSHWQEEHITESLLLRPCPTGGIDYLQISKYYRIDIKNVPHNMHSRQPRQMYLCAAPCHLGRTLVCSLAQGTN